MTENLDPIRLAAALIISAVLTVVVAVIGFFVSGLMAPKYQFTFSDGLIIALFVAGCFSVLLGFSYYLIGYWQETKNIGNPDKTSQEKEIKSGNKPHYKNSHDYTGELEPPRRIEKVGGNIGQELFDIRPNMEYNPGKIEDFGLRQFNDNDDWISMKPGKKK